jgi:hypothetical protein
MVWLAAPRGKQCAEDVSHALMKNRNSPRVSAGQHQ